jgi:hypothetical protein
MAKVIGKSEVLKRALHSLIPDGGIKPNEFTIEDLRAENPMISNSAIRSRLDIQIEAGKMAKRKLVFNGKQQNAYRFLD